MQFHQWPRFLKKIIMFKKSSWKEILCLISDTEVTLNYKLTWQRREKLEIQKYVIPQLPVFVSPKIKLVPTYTYFCPAL